MLLSMLWARGYSHMAHNLSIPMGTNTTTFAKKSG